MSAAREWVLARIRDALPDVPRVDDANESQIPREYRQSSSETRHEIVNLFVHRAAEYRATVSRTDSTSMPAAIGRILADRGLRRIGIPPALPETWLPEGFEFVPDEGLSTDVLDTLDGTLTGCRVAIALTGTIVLDGGPLSGRRALTLVPDYHLCVLPVLDIVSLPPEGISLLRDAAVEGRPITLVAGPSATSDIELNRVEGVHGPRTLDILLVEDQ